MRRYVLGFAFLLIGACSVDTTGLGDPEDFRLSATPESICPGDASRLSWEALDVPTSRDYCAEPYQTGRVCTINGDCDADETCIDQQCIGPGDDPEEIDFGNGCPIDGVIEINQLEIATNEVDPVLDGSDGRSRQDRGSKAVSPPSTTVYTAAYEVDDVRVATTSVTVNVLGLEDVTEVIDFGTFFCRSAGETVHRTLGSSTTGFDPSSSILLNLVTNESAATVVVSSSSPSVPAVVLSPGESSTDFNGRVPREWSVRLDPTELPPPTSCTVDTGGFEPIEVKLAFSVSCGQ